MKALLITFVVVGAIVFALIQFGGVASFDPAEQSRAFRAAVQPGTDWTTLVEMAKPQEYMSIRSDDSNLGGGPGNPIKYRAELFERNVADGKFANGFVLRFTFGAGDVQDVYFDASGKVSGTDEPITTQDLLDGSAVQKMQEMN